MRRIDGQSYVPRVAASAGVANSSAQTQALRAKTAFETHRIRARAIVNAIDHVEKEIRGDNPIANGKSRAINRVVVFSDSSSMGVSPLAGALRSNLPDGVTVDVFALERLRGVVTRPTDAVVVELADPTEKELKQVRSGLSASWKGAKYRGLLSGPDQKTPEEIDKPVSRRIIPGRPEVAKGTRPEPVVEAPVLKKPGFIR